MFTGDSPPHFRRQNSVAHYVILKADIDLLNLIQVGITLSDGESIYLSHRSGQVFVTCSMPRRRRRRSGSTQVRSVALPAEVSDSPQQSPELISPLMPSVGFWKFFDNGSILNTATAGPSMDLFSRKDDCAK
ncbi:hypothetical protein U1Q18_002219 [Sarracenia purpurea var. burkii]